MAQNVLSTVISNRDATPKILTDAYVSGGVIEESQGFCVCATTTDAVNSTYRCCQVPSNARVSSVEIQNAACGGSAAINVGVYYPTFIPVGAGLAASNASAAISASFFASAFSVVSAATPTNQINQSGTNTIALQEQPLWQAIGLASDPGIMLDIVATVSTVFASKGTIGMKVRYCK